MKGLIVCEKDYAAVMRHTVEPKLAALRTEEEVPVRGGCLHAENYILPDAPAAVVLLHGFCESAEKFREMVWVFVQCGLSVYSYDHRGHGRSLRQVSSRSLSHVERFADYVEDCTAFVERCVRKTAGDKPLYLYAHSMGGAVGAHMLVEHPTLFARAVLTSPMIAPSTAPFPAWSGRALAETVCFFGKGKKRVFFGHNYDPAGERFEDSCSTSRARFDYYQGKRHAHPYLQNNAATYQWARESMRQTAQLLHDENADRVTTRVLLCRAGNDTLVSRSAQERFAARLPHARIAVFEAAKHEIYNSVDEVFAPYADAVTEFFTEQETEA